MDDIPKELISADDVEGERIWVTVNKYFGIRTVFGSIACNAGEDAYRQIIRGKNFVWFGEGLVNFAQAVEKKEKTAYYERFVFNDFQYAFGAVSKQKIFNEEVLIVVPLLVVKDSHNQQWAVDGALQQFHPSVKGLAITPWEEAKAIYRGLEIYSKDSFATAYEDDGFQSRFLKKLR